MTYTYVTKPVINSNLLKIIGHLPPHNLELGPWIAGGAARLTWYNRNVGDHDIDVFFKNEQQWAEYSQFCSNKFTIEHSITTSNASTNEIKIDDFKIKLQIIKKDWYENYTGIFNNFDFTCCQFVTDGKTVVATEDAIADCSQEILRHNSYTKRELDTRRIIKYLLYGFKPDNNILTQIVKLNHSNELTSNWSQNEY